MLRFRAVSAALLFLSLGVPTFTVGLTPAFAQQVAAQQVAVQQVAAKPTLDVGSVAPKLPVAEWIKGKPVALSDGKVHVVEFWATWCVPCRYSIPQLTELSKKYAGKADVTGISVQERGENIPVRVKDFVKTMGSQMNYRVARDNDAGTVAKSWLDASGEEGIPVAFVVNKAGKIAWFGHPMDGLDEAVAKVVAGNFPVAAAKKDMMARQKAREAAQSELAAKNARLDELFAPVLALAQNGKFAEAVAAIDKTLETNAQYKGDVAPLKISLLMQYDEAAAQSFAAKAAGAELRNDVQTLAGTAWAIAGTGSTIVKPDYAAAVILAEAAATATQNKNALVLDVLAYAYEKSGKTSEALTAARKAVALFAPTSTDPNLPRIKAHLAALEADKAAKKPGAKP